MDARRRLLALSIAVAAGVASPGAGWSQAPPATIVQPTPEPGPGNQIPPLGTLPPAAAVPPAQPSVGATAARPTLIAKPGDPVSMDEVTLPERPVLIFAGRSTWDPAWPNLRAAFARIEAELAKAGIAPAGRPLALFADRTDDEFRYEAMVPIASSPNPLPALPAEMRFGVTPSGKAFRFVHQGAYAEIDTTFETLSSYLEAKDIASKDEYLEEYVNDVADADDTGLEVNIFVLPR